MRGTGAGGDQNFKGTTRNNSTYLKKKKKDGEEWNEANETPKISM